MTKETEVEVIESEGENCGNCRFWIPEPEDAEGVEGSCHRHAPHCVMSGRMNELTVDTVWPWVASDDWCGEWEGGK